MSKASEERRRKWDAMPDLATSRERRWLDMYVKLAMWTTDVTRYKVLNRTGPKDGEFSEIRCFSDRPNTYCVLVDVLGGSVTCRTTHRTSSRPMLLSRLIAEVRRLQAEERAYNRKKAEQEQGAYI